MNNCWNGEPVYGPYVWLEATKAVQAHVNAIIRREFAYRQLAVHLIKQLQDAHPFLPLSIANKAEKIVHECRVELDKIAGMK